MKKTVNILLKTSACALAGLLCSQTMVVLADPQPLPELSIIEYEQVHFEALNDIHEHNIVIDEGVEPGLFTTGLSQGSHCSDCGEVITKQEVLPMKPLVESLRYGSVGADVLEVQQRLYDLGFLEVTPDGEYGSYTEDAVSRFQTANGLETPDGIFGNWSLEIMRNGSVADETQTSDTQTADSQTGQDQEQKTESLGINADDIYSVQERLYSLGYLNTEPTGYFGDMTHEALRKFQLYNGLAVTGELDGSTVSALNDSASAAFRVLYYGLSGSDVFNLQTALISAGYMDGSADGAFGSVTQNAVMALQEANGLNPDGSFGEFFVAGIFSSGSSAQHRTHHQESSEQTAAADSGVSLSLGAYGDEVYAMQEALWNLGFLASEPDSDFGYGTYNAVMAYQYYNGYAVTGTADQAMLDQLYYGDSLGFTEIYYGSYGYDVYLIESALSSLGYFGDVPDYDYDDATQSAVASFQENNNMWYTYGAVDFDTLCLLMGDPAANETEDMEGRGSAAEIEDPVIDSNADLGQQIVDYAMQWVGVTPYVDAYERINENGEFYNSLTDGTDCSGFTHLIFGAFGIYVPTGSDEYQGGVGVMISEEELLPGDIVVYRYGGHVGIYAGNGMLIHCSTPESGTVYADMWYDEPTAYVRVVF